MDSRDGWFSFSTFKFKDGVPDLRETLSTSSLAPAFAQASNTSPEGYLEQ